MAIGTLSIANNGNTIFGCGALKQLGAQLDALGVKRPFVVTDKGIVTAGLIDNLKEQLVKFTDYHVFEDTPANPNEVSVNIAAARYIESAADGIIGFGGGSSLDLAKATGLRVTHDGPMQKFTTQEQGFKCIGDTPPMIAIPTTAGTGSEVARAAVIILASSEKRIIASPKLVPDVAILDPELTLGLSPLLTAATGMDAISHCIEAILSPIINPTAEAIGLCALTAALGDRALLKVVDNGADLNARATMMSVSTQGAMAFSKGLGAVHAMSHACGKDETLRLHHGTLNAVLLPIVLRLNFESVPEKKGLIASAIGVSENTDIANFFLNLNADLKLPPNLARMGITNEMIPELAAHAAIDFCNTTNPVRLNSADYADLFRQALNI